jgi:hypothetical protein
VTILGAAGPGELYGATVAELERLGASESVHAPLLLAVALSIDGGVSGSGLAALVRAFRETLSDVRLISHQHPNSKLQELRRSAPVVVPLKRSRRRR